MFITGGTCPMSFYQWNVWLMSLETAAKREAGDVGWQSWECLLPWLVTLIEALVLPAAVFSEDLCWQGAYLALWWWLPCLAFIQWLPLLTQITFGKIPSGIACCEWHCWLESDLHSHTAQKVLVVLLIQFLWGPLLFYKIRVVPLCRVLQWKGLTQYSFAFVYPIFYTMGQYKLTLPW